MSKRPRRNHTPSFKAKVALAAIKMLWGGSGENISIAALSKPMEPRYDETQSQDCERSQPVSRPAGYGRDGDRGDRDESIELACGWHCSWCRAPAAEETGDRRARIDLHHAGVAFGLIVGEGHRPDR